MGFEDSEGINVYLEKNIYNILGCFFYFFWKKTKNNWAIDILCLRKTEKGLMKEKEGMSSMISCDSVLWRV